MQGNSFFGFSGGGGSTPPPVSNSWLLNGNAEGSEKYFGTNDNYSIPIYTNGAAIGVFSNSGDFGFGTTSPTSRVHIKGSDSTSSNYALKVDNSASSPLLYVRNDGVTLFNNSAFINNSTSPFQSLLAGDYLGTLNNNLNILAGISTPSSNTVRISYYGNTQWLTALSIQNSGASFGNLILMPDGGNVGIGTITPTATIHGKGIDSTSANYALKVDDSASSPILYVRNDGKVGINISSPLLTFSVKPNANLDGIILQEDSSNYYASFQKDGTRGFLALYDGNQTKVIFNSPSYSSCDFINTSYNLAIGLNAASAKVHIYGINSTSSDYALKIDNSSFSPLLYVRNDGIVSIGKTLQIQRYNYSSTKAFWIEAEVTTENTLMSTQNADLVFKTRSSGTVETMRMTNAGKIIINNGSYLTLGVLDPTLDKYAYIDSAGNITASAGLKFSVCTTGTTTGMVAMQIEAGGNVGIGTSPTARTHIQGVDATSSNYALKVDNSASSPLLYVANNGNVSIGISTALSKMHVFGIDSATKVNQRLEPVSGVTEDTTGNTVNTTDATANVTAQTIAVPTDKVISIESTIVYRKTGGAGVGTTGDGTTIKLNSSVKNVGGTLTLDTVQNTYTGTVNAIAGVSATYTISGTNVLVSVTGVVNNNITWNVITKVNTVA